MGHAALATRIDYEIEAECDRFKMEIHAVAGNTLSAEDMLLLLGNPEAMQDVRFEVRKALKRSLARYKPRG